MDLLQNPFYILKATPRDNRRRIIELAEERSLLLDSNACTQAWSDLTNPRKRLCAEIAWLPGMGPKRTSEVLKLLKSSADDLLEYLFSENKPMPIASANLLAASLSRLSDYSSDDLSLWICLIAWDFENTVPEVLCKVINEERIVSGFPEVTDLSAVEAEIQERRRHYRQVIKSALDNLSHEELVKAVTDTVDTATKKGEAHGPILIDDMVDSYEVEVQEFLEKEEKNIKTLAEKLRAAADAERPDSTLAPMVNQLIQVVKDWDSIAKPIQISTKSRGLNHDASNRVAGIVRGLAIHLFNEHDKLDFSQQLTNMLQKVFADVINVAERTAEDAEKLDEIAKERNSNDRLGPIWTLCIQAQENADKNPDLSDREAQRVIDAAPRLIALACSNGKVPDEVESKCKDSIALAILHCAIAYGNKTEKWKPCTFFLNEALKYAWSDDVRNKIESNLSIVQRNYKLYGELSPISSAPSLSTINGIGFKLYGSTDIDPETHSHLSTYYFTFFLIPIFPICRYRVIPTENGYKFLGKAPLRVFDKWHLAFVLLVVLALVVFNVNSGNNSETTDRSNPDTASSQPNVLSAPQSNDDYIAVGQYLCSRSHHNTVQNLKPDQTEEQAIKANEARLKTEIDEIKRLNAEIDSYEIDRDSQSSIDNYNNLVNDYNSRIKLHRINVADQKKRIDNYNVQVETYNNYLIPLLFQ